MRHGLADPVVGCRLMGLVRAALGAYPQGLTCAQRQGEAEELFQEVAKQAIASAERFDPDRGSLLHWLGGIVWNVARHRRPARAASTEPSTMEQTILDTQGPVLDGVANRLDFHQILQSLPAADAELLALYADGCTAPEIAARLELTPANVRVRICRALKRARAMFPNENSEAAHD